MEVVENGTGESLCKGRTEIFRFRDYPSIFICIKNWQESISDVIDWKEHQIL